jgi:hypothetical protein
MDANQLRQKKMEPVVGSRMDYPEAARAIALYLLEFCDENFFYPDMIADAARKAAKEIENLRHIQATDWMVIDAFRYALGRATYQVSITTQWLIAHWEKLPGGSRAIIQRDLEEAFELDDRQRHDQRSGQRHFYLGHDCDRASWQLVRNLWAATQQKGDSES